jgi:hypothetical protein
MPLEKGRYAMNAAVTVDESTCSLARTIEHFRLCLVGDGMLALMYGYPREDITLFVISADSREWRTSVLDKILPDADWGKIRKAGERPFAVGVASRKMQEGLDKIFPDIIDVREKSSETLIHPVIAIDRMSRHVISRLLVPDPA